MSYKFIEPPIGRKVVFIKIVKAPVWDTNNKLSNLIGKPIKQFKIGDVTWVEEEFYKQLSVMNVRPEGNRYGVNLSRECITVVPPSKKYDIFVSEKYKYRYKKKKLDL